MQAINTPKHHNRVITWKPGCTVSAGPVKTAVEQKLLSSLNCNRIALACLKVKGNRLPESLMMHSAEALLHWLDRQLNGLEQSDAALGDPMRKSATALQALLDSASAASRKLALLHLFEIAIPGEYLSRINREPGVTDALEVATMKLLSNDTRFSNLRRELMFDRAS